MISTIQNALDVIFTIKTQWPTNLLKNTLANNFYNKNAEGIYTPNIATINLICPFDFVLDKQHLNWVVKWNSWKLMIICTSSHFSGTMIQFFFVSLKSPTTLLSIQEKTIPRRKTESITYAGVIFHFLQLLQPQKSE